MQTPYTGGFLGDLFVQYMFRVLAHKGLYSIRQYSPLVTRMWAYAASLERRVSIPVNSVHA